MGHLRCVHRGQGDCRLGGWTIHFGASRLVSGLLHATSKERVNWEIAGAGYGIYWPDIDENLSMEGLLRGALAPQIKTPIS